MSHVLAAVLRAEPDWTALPPDTPASIRRLLRRCLEKDRKRRLDSAAAVGLELDDARTTPAAEAPAASARRAIAPIAIASARCRGADGGARVVVVHAARAARGGTADALHDHAVRRTLPWQPSTQAAARDFAVAPDGSFLVYRAGEQGQLVVRWFDRLDASPLAGVTSASMPFVSPDSRWIGFVEDDLTLKKVAVTGGAPVTLARLPVWPRGASWVDDCHDHHRHQQPDDRAACACRPAAASRPC